MVIWEMVLVGNSSGNAKMAILAMGALPSVHASLPTAVKHGIINAVHLENMVTIVMQQGHVVALINVQI